MFDGNDCVSQVKHLHPVLEEKKAERHTFDIWYVLYLLNIILTKELLQILD